MIDELVLHEGNYVYIRFKALIWMNNCLLEHKTILQSSVKLLELIYEKVEQSKPLVVSLKDVIEAERALEPFFSEIVNKIKRPIIFIHTESFGDKLMDTLQRLPPEHRPRFENDDNPYIFKVYCSKNEDEVVRNLISKVTEAEHKFLENAIKGCHKKVTHRLISTVILTNVEFDASKIISKPSCFIWICLFIADKVKEFIEKLKGENYNPNSPPIKLLAVSLRGSPFASAVSLLTDIGYDTIDHLGPKHKLFDVEVFENFKKGIQYIYIGDFVIGGTEIKIAKAYAELLGCELDHAVVLSSLLPPSIFKDFTLIPLTLIKEIVTDAEYQITDPKE